MREAMGGSLLYYIIIPIIFLFIVFIAFIMNYASAYRASNYVISQIETCDADVSHCNHLPDGLNTIGESIRKKYYYTGGFSIDSLCYVQNSKGTVYRVALPVYFDLPLIGRVGVYNVISESKTIYNIYEDDRKVLDDSIKSCN